MVIRKFLHRKGNALISLAICILYATSDEIHQNFVKGRSCEFTDVLIDSGGVAFGIIIAVALFSAVTFVISKKQDSRGV